MPRQNLLSLCLLALMALVCTAARRMPPTGSRRASGSGAALRQQSFALRCLPRRDRPEFREKEGKFWNSKLYITGFTHVREIAFRPWESGNIPRRYCTAQVAISDGKVRTMNFSIIEDGGFASIGAGVEFCVVGLDRNWAFNPGLPDGAPLRAPSATGASAFCS